MVLSCNVSEIRRVIGWKLRTFSTPLSFNVLARGDPFRISGWIFYPKTSGRVRAFSWAPRVRGQTHWHATEDRHDLPPTNQPAKVTVPSWKLGIRNFQPITRRISETVQDRTKVTTPHSTTLTKLRQRALFGRRLRTRHIDDSQSPMNSRLDAEIRECDTAAKHMKQYGDSHSHARERQLAIGDKVLVRQARRNKLSSYYEPHSYIISDKRGTMITAQQHGRRSTRDSKRMVGRRLVTYPSSNECRPTSAAHRRTVQARRVRSTTNSGSVRRTTSSIRVNHNPHLATGALLLLGHVSGTACQHTCATKTFLTTISGVNLRSRIGFNVASGAQCDILLNCAIEIFLLNWTNEHQRRIYSFCYAAWTTTLQCAGHSQTLHNTLDAAAAAAACYRPIGCRPQLWC